LGPGDPLAIGSFKVSELDETLGDAYFYGVSFLVDAGYFNPEKRFWTKAAIG
jgi:hypothetical protein